MPTIKEQLKLDCEKETERIVQSMRETAKELKRKGAVVGISGGIDSSVAVALSVKAFGSDKVVALTMPEKDSDDETMSLCKMLIDTYSLNSYHEEITDILTACGCYKRRDDAIRTILPEYDENWKSKIVLPSIVKTNQLRFFTLVAESPTGERFEKRLTTKAYLGVVAASNFKQRVRKMIEYYYADRFNYFDIGTPNRLEYDQGFFVKNGDGSADIKPIAHLYKTQVYELARYLGVPEEIVSRPPTTDTYSMEQSQDEFYFSLPYDKMDICLYALNNNIDKEVVASELELSLEQVDRVFGDILQKRKTTSYQHRSPLLLENIFQP